MGIFPQWVSNSKWITQTLGYHGLQGNWTIHRFIDVIYWLYLFISFIYSIWWLSSIWWLFSIGFIHWLYFFFGFVHSIWSLDLFIGLIYWLYLFIDFIYSLCWLYLSALSKGFSFSVYSIHPHSKLSQFFSRLRKEHPYTSLNIHIPCSHGKNCSPYITSSTVFNYAHIATVTSPYSLN